MISPRSSGRYGSTFSYHAPLPPKMNLLTSRWSPISRVPSMEAEGILKACTTKLVPNNARSTVTSSDSRYSEIVVGSSCGSAFSVSAGATGSNGSSTFSAVSSAIRSQPFRSTRLLRSFQEFHRALRSPLLGFFFCASFASGHAFAVNPNLHLEDFLMVRPAFARQPVFGGRPSMPLQEFLKRGLAVRVRDSFAALLKCLFEEQPLKHLSRRP